MGIFDFEALFPPPPSAHGFRNESAVISRSQIIKIEHVLPTKLGETDNFSVWYLASIVHQKVVVKLLKSLHLPQNMLAYLLL